MQSATESCGVIDCHSRFFIDIGLVLIQKQLGFELSLILPDLRRSVAPSFLGQNQHDNERARSPETCARLQRNDESPPNNLRRRGNRPRRYGGVLILSSAPRRTPRPKATTTPLDWLFRQCYMSATEFAPKRFFYGVRNRRISHKQTPRAIHSAR